ncbi:hypothetical protein POM88_041028 [Heracleum sosnowskyi]|uniref:Oligopeptide transporter n=1 Tax=Heracleum sosnowskyi TaxID=360622 RepID=A0AAD8HDE5_9APIA|nr:hypothetical protein POM88_041028 [Heracleum sosnowskyi]
MARGPGWSSFTAFLQISYLIAQPHRRAGPGIGSHGLSKGVSGQHCACNGSVDCEGHGGVVVDGGRTLACAIAFFFTFPIGIITAITNKAPGLNIITEYIIGYIYPGYQVANMYVKVYGYINMSQEITFLQDFKLGKIPPRTMFLAQVVGTLIASLVYLITTWWLRNYASHLCNCIFWWHCMDLPGDHLFYYASISW